VVAAFLSSALAWALTRDFGRVISIMILDFGTGVRIAIPTTILTTMISGARQGVLFRNGQSIDDPAKVDRIVFDKTGTLTTGNPIVVEVVPQHGFDSDEALRLAAGAEGHLPYPLARAIPRAARKRA
jgi:Cu2+-exporting ATPase